MVMMMETMVTEGLVVHKRNGSDGIPEEAQKVAKPMHEEAQIVDVGIFEEGQTVIEGMSEEAQIVDEGMPEEAESMPREVQTVFQGIPEEVKMLAETNPGKVKMLDTRMSEIGKVVTELMPEMKLGIGMPDIVKMLSSMELPGKAKSVAKVMPAIAKTVAKVIHTIAKTIFKGKLRKLKMFVITGVYIEPTHKETTKNANPIVPASVVD